MIGVPHPDFGEAVVAIVVPSAEHSISAERIAEVLSDQLAKFKQPKRIELVAELPRNTMGKVQKKALREDYVDLFAQK